MTPYQNIFSCSSESLEFAFFASKLYLTEYAFFLHGVLSNNFLLKYFLPQCRLSMFYASNIRLRFFQHGVRFHLPRGLFPCIYHSEHAQWMCAPNFESSLLHSPVSNFPSGWTSTALHTNSIIINTANAVATSAFEPDHNASTLILNHSWYIFCTTTDFVASYSKFQTPKHHTDR